MPKVARFNINKRKSFRGSSGAHRSQKRDRELVLGTLLREILEYNGQRLCKAEIILVLLTLLKFSMKSAEDFLYC
jgi:hypothetical protein